MTTGSENSKGQSLHAKNMEEIEDLIQEYPPMRLHRLVSKLSRDMGLTPDTLRRNYIGVLIDSGDLVYGEDGLYHYCINAPVMRKLEKQSLASEMSRKELDEEINKIEGGSEKQGRVRS